MKQKYIEPYMMSKARGTHHTRTGIIRYPDKRVRVFGLKDVIRILVACNNRDTDSEGYQDILNHEDQYRVIFKIAYRNYAYALSVEETKYADTINKATANWRAEAGIKFEQFLTGFDAVVRAGQAILGWVPGSGELLTVVADFYRFVRAHFPTL